MCSKLKLSKNINAPQEINLKVGDSIKITTVDGREIVDVFQGHLRMERWNSYWKNRSSAIYVVPVSAFTEGRGDKAKNFNLKRRTQGAPGPAVAFIQSKSPNGDLGLFLATQPAIPQVKKHHSRMPALLKETYQPKFVPQMKKILIPEILPDKTVV